MTKDEALKLALEALELINIEFVCGNGSHNAKKDRHEWDEPCPITDRWKKAITAIKEALAQPEPMRLRRGDILRCIETDELCTVWSTSTTGKTLIKWGANDFGGYTAEQIGELFWLEPSPDDLELAAEKSDNYAAFHAGYRFAVAHPLAQPEQEPVACDGDFPEGFDASLGVPAQALRVANAIMCDVIGKREWDVPCTAQHVLSFAKKYTTPQRKPLTDEEIILIVADCASSHQHTDIHFARAIEAAHGIKGLV